VDAPVITRIIDLPDSLKPEVIDLSERPKPRTIIIPKDENSGQTYTGPDGEIIQIKPPEKKLIPAFEGREEYINYLKENDSFDLGKGGLPYYKSYTTDDGLAMNNIRCATVDKRGHIWFGTWGQGISRFDGLKFTNFSTVTGLASNLVSSILEDVKGNIWIGTYGGGVSCYDGIKFTTYITEPGNYRRIKNMTEGKSGRIWINTEAGIQFYDPGQDSVINFDSINAGLINYTFNGIKADKNGNLWIGTNNGVICLDAMNNQVINSFTTKNGLVNNNVNFIHEDQKGRIWIATDDGVSCYEPENRGKITNYSTINPFENNNVFHISEDSKERLWFGLADGTVSRFENNGTESKFASFDAPGGLLTIDSFDKLWFRTYNRGVICLSPPVTGESGSFISYSRDQGLPYNAISSIYQDKKDNFWFSSLNITRFDGTHFTYYTPEQGVPPTWVNFIFEDRSEKIWFGGWGSYSGVYCYDPTTNGMGESFTWYNNEQGFHGNFVSSIEDSSGNIWFSSWHNGVFYFDGKTTINYTMKQGLGNNSIRKIVEDKTGNIWFAKAGDGLTCFDPSNGGVFTIFTINQGLAGNSVDHLTIDSQGNLWIATRKGLNFLGAATLVKIKDSPDFLKGKNGKIKNIFKTFKTDDGLPVNLITNITELRKGKMALGSSHGLTIFSYPVDSIEHFNSLQNIETFNFQSGFPVRTIENTNNSMFVDDDGILWIASLSEETPLIWFDYDALHRNDKLPTVTIQKIKINEEAIAFHTLANNSAQNNEGTEYSSPVYIMDEMTKRTIRADGKKHKKRNWSRLKKLKRRMKI
jgi:ligand-binding sensor domain-containing protein